MKQSTTPISRHPENRRIENEAAELIQSRLNAAAGGIFIMRTAVEAVRNEQVSAVKVDFRPSYPAAGRIAAHQTEASAQKLAPVVGLADTEARQITEEPSPTPQMDSDTFLSEPDFSQLTELERNMYVKHLAAPGEVILNDIKEINKLN